MNNEQHDMSEIPSAKIRDTWLDSMLPEVAFSGWTDSVALKSAVNVGLDADQQALGAPSGVIDLIEHFFERAERIARQRLEEMDLSDMRVRDKVSLGTMEWLRALENDKEAVRRAVSWGVLPWRMSQPLQRLWQVSDMIWTLAGDTSTDYNQYTKRGLLAMAMPSIVLHWLEHDDSEELREFVDRQLNRASTVGRSGSEIPKRIWDCISSLGEPRSNAG